MNIELEKIRVGKSFKTHALGICFGIWRAIKRKDFPRQRTNNTGHPNDNRVRSIKGPT